MESMTSKSSTAATVASSFCQMINSPFGSGVRPNLKLTPNGNVIVIQAQWTPHPTIEAEREALSVA